MLIETVCARCGTAFRPTREVIFGAGHWRFCPDCRDVDVRPPDRTKAAPDTNEPRRRQARPVLAAGAGRDPPLAVRLSRPDAARQRDRAQVVARTEGDQKIRILPELDFENPNRRRIRDTKADLERRLAEVRAAEAAGGRIDPATIRRLEGDIARQDDNLRHFDAVQAEIDAERAARSPEAVARRRQHQIEVEAKAGARARWIGDDESFEREWPTIWLEMRIAAAAGTGPLLEPAAEREDRADVAAALARSGPR